MLDDITLTAEELRRFTKINIVACGTAYHVGVVAKYAFEELLRIPVEVDVASEFRYRDPILNENTLMIIISQSGETADTLAALREAKRAGCRVLSVVNVVGSTIATESDDVLYTWAGPEISVASTKAYSTQLAVIYLLALYIGKQLTCVFVDHGLLRKNEMEEVCEVFGPNGQFELNFVCVNARQRFYDKLAGVSEPEKKRKIIGEEFIRVFEEEAKKIGAVDFLAQGTIYPDVVESGLGGESTVIKSHHNVGGLPDYVDFKEIVEPLRDLFKDETRQAGRELGLPEYLVSRQPFPGPGLAIRIIGEVTPDKVKMVQEADAIWREEIAKAGLDKSISQYYAALTNMRSVGVMGDERTYDYAVALRAVTTTDFMTAEAAEIPWSLLQTVTSRIVNEVQHVNRVLYDCTGKPPATIEFE